MQPVVSASQYQNQQWQRWRSGAKENKISAEESVSGSVAQ